MMKYNIIVTLIISFLITLITFVNASEPQKPDVYKVLNSEGEAKIVEVMSLPARDAFKRLKSTDFIIDEDLLQKAIFKTFRHRKTEGVNLSLHYLSLPQREIRNGRLIDRTAEHFVAKNILNVFPEQSVNKLIKLYKKSDPVVRGNIIRVSGKISSKDIKKLLIDALNDKTFCEKSDSEIEGFPLRVCDEAYNQLVLRYDIKDVLRTIGNDLTIEDRDYHIDILKKKLKE